MRRLASAFAFGLVLAAAPAALADVVPPDVSACSGKTAGTACNLSAGGSGVCAAAKCSRFNYGGWDKDASATPPTIEYDCVKCVAGSADAGTAPTNESDDSSGCSMTVRRAGPWALALIPALALALLERRRANRANRAN